jgi:hypothetical protein
MSRSISDLPSPHERGAEKTERQSGRRAAGFIDK